MIVGYVEPSGESPDLARAEVAGAVEALGGRPGGPPLEGDVGLLEVVVEGERTLAELAGRLALAWRTLVPVEGPGDLEALARREGASGNGAAFRPLGAPGSPADAEIRGLGRAFVEGGGTIDLRRPSVRYWLARPRGGAARLLREVAAVDRSSAASRAMPRLPFRRPVSLPPRLARAAVNLGSVRPGDRVLDPFLGTGSLLAEAALLGAEVYGIDADPAMVRGALRNLEQLGVRAAALAQGDARSSDLPGAPPAFDVIVTDPPYGRSSASVGAEPPQLVPEALGRWASRLRPDGRLVVVGPSGPPAVREPWVETCRVPVRVHRSLTREFCLYRQRR